MPAYCPLSCFFARLFQHLKGMICQTGPGFMRPRPATGAFPGSRNCASSSPAAPSPPTRWSGAREWRAGRGQGYCRTVLRRLVSAAGYSAFGRRANQVLAATGGGSAVDRCRSCGTCFFAVWCLSSDSFLVIPAPWVATNFYQWIISRLRVPQRPDLAFTGEVGDIWYVFVALALTSYVGLSGSHLLHLSRSGSGLSSWMTVRWIASNLSSNGQPLPIAFGGSPSDLCRLARAVVHLDHHHYRLGMGHVAWMRWICRNVSGTQREIVFNATGSGNAVADPGVCLGCMFLIPIPWVLRWYAGTALA